MSTTAILLYSLATQRTPSDLARSQQFCEIRVRHTWTWMVSLATFDAGSLLAVGIGDTASFDAPAAEFEGVEAAD